MSAEQLPTPECPATAAMDAIDALLDAKAIPYVLCDGTATLSRMHRLPPGTPDLRLAASILESHDVEAPVWLRIEAIADPVKDDPQPPSIMTTVYAYYDQLAVQYEFSRTAHGTELRKTLAPNRVETRPALGSLACTDGVIDRMIAITLANDAAAKCGLFDVDPPEQAALLELATRLRPAPRT